MAIPHVGLSPLNDLGVDRLKDTRTCLRAAAVQYVVAWFAIEMIGRKGSQADSERYCSHRWHEFCARLGEDLEMPSVRYDRGVTTFGGINLRHGIALVGIDTRKPGAIKATKRAIGEELSRRPPGEFEVVFFEKEQS